MLAALAMGWHRTISIGWSAGITSERGFEVRFLGARGDAGNGDRKWGRTPFPTLSLNRDCMERPSNPEQVGKPDPHQDLAASYQP